MDPIVVAAGAALVSAMASDAWQSARDRMVDLWRRVRADEAVSVEADLAAARAEVLAGRSRGDTAVESALEGWWQVRLHQLLRDHPQLADELRTILNESLRPALEAGGAPVSFTATASGFGQVFQAGRDQFVVGRSAGDR